MAELYRYAAFISYSSKDAAFAKRLHQALESYNIPASLGQFDLIGGGKKNRVYPVFRDREELSAGNLGDRIEAALKASAAIVVICTPHSATSPWVQKEIEYFEGLGRREKIFSIIADDAPLFDENGADATRASFPPIFLGDALTDRNALEPLAADARKGKDGFRNAWLKVLAGMIGVTPGQIIDRDRRRRRRNRRLAIAMVATGLTGAALIGADISAKSFRTDMSVEANAMTGAGWVLDAAPRAIAGLPAHGDLLPSASSGAINSLLQSSAGLSIATEVGLASEIQISNDSRFLAWRSDQDLGFLLDRTADDAPISLGRLGGAYGFSSDNRFMFYVNATGTGVLVSLANGGQGREQLGQTHSFAFASDGKHLIAVDGPTDTTGGGRVATLSVYDLSDPTRHPAQIGGVARYQLSPDGGSLVSFDSTLHGRLHALSNPQATEDLGEINDAGFSPSGRWLLTTNDQYQGVLRDLHRPSAPAQRLFARPFEFVLSPDDAHLAIRGEDGLWSLRSLQNLPALPTVLGRGNGFVNPTFSPDGRFLAWFGADGGTLLHVANAAALIPLGRLATSATSVMFSRDGSILLTTSSDFSVVVRNMGRLRAPPTALGRVDSLAASDDGRFLVWRNPDHQTWTLRQISDARDVPLGNLDWAAFSHSNHALISIEKTGAGRLPGNRLNGDATMRDLRRPLLAANLQLREQVCAASANALRPLQRTVGQRSAVNGVRGRPWNPCDWRGLGAITPNAIHGDGWFEGPLQWVRLMQVRYLGGRDWACEETTTGASAHIRAARANMCARFASRQPEGNAATSE